MVMKRGQLTRESKVQLERTDMRKVRRMCGKKLQDRVTSAELRQMMGIDIRTVLQ